jgi:hypothetical protein
MYDEPVAVDGVDGTPLPPDAAEYTTPSENIVDVTIWPRSSPIGPNNCVQWRLTTLTKRGLHQHWQQHDGLLLPRTTRIRRRVHVEVRAAAQHRRHSTRANLAVEVHERPRRHRQTA